MKRKSRFPSKRTPFWLITYADLMTNMLVLFILLLSFSVIDTQKLDSMVRSFNEQSIMGLPTQHPIKSNTIEVNEEVEQKLKELLENEAKLKQILAVVDDFSKHNKFKIIANQTKQGVELILPEAMLFQKGQADIMEPAKAFLNRIIPLLKNISNEIKVEGHTDNVPIYNEKYPTNWELSTARASRVARYLIEQHQLDPKRFTVIGFGEYRPAFPNNSEEKRRKNRRVVITISSFEKKQEKKQITP